MMKHKIKFLLSTFILLSSILQITYAEEIKIPDWIRNNARWWSNGEIDDKTFANGIQFMMKEGIIKIPVTESKQVNQDTKIPEWVRTNAKWWSNGEIDDKTFANGIQYMISTGIISMADANSQNLSPDNLDVSKCDQFTTAAEKRICQKEIELDNKIKNDIEKSTPTVIGPVTFYYVDNKIEKTSSGTILTIYFVVENKDISHDITMSCPVNSCNYVLSDGQKEIQYTTNTLVYGSMTLLPNSPKLLEWTFYKGLDYDPTKDYSFKVKEPWGSGTIPLGLN